MHFGILTPTTPSCRLKNLQCLFFHIYRMVTIEESTQRGPGSQDSWVLLSSLVCQAMNQFLNTLISAAVNRDNLIGVELPSEK